MTISAAARPVAADLLLGPETREVKPVWRGWLHLVWFEASLVLGTLLLVSAPAHHRGPTAIYVASVSGLFGTSALYHRGQWRARTRLVLQRLDHAMIFLLIAGTATPLYVVGTTPRVNGLLLPTMWILTCLALLIHMVWMSAPEILVGSTYVALGCSGGAALPAVLTHAGSAVFVLVVAGGALYITGAVLYRRRRPDPDPTVFGYHEVFHCFVCAAAALHYVAVTLMVLPG